MDFKKLAGNIDKHFSVLCLAVMLFTVFLQVFMRVVFNSPLVGVEEFVRYLMIWIVLFPLAYTLRDGGHIGMTELRDMLPKAVGRALTLFSDLCSILIFAVVSYSSYLVIANNPRNTTATLLIPFWVFFLPNLLGFVLLTIGYILAIRNRFNRRAAAKQA